MAPDRASSPAAGKRPPRRDGGRGGGPPLSKRRSASSPRPLCGRTQCRRGVASEVDAIGFRARWPKRRLSPECEDSPPMALSLPHDRSRLVPCPSHACSGRAGAAGAAALDTSAFAGAERESRASEHGRLVVVRSGRIECGPRRARSPTRAPLVEGLRIYAFVYALSQTLARAGTSDHVALRGAATARRRRREYMRVGIEPPTHSSTAIRGATTQPAKSRSQFARPTFPGSPRQAG